MKALLDTSVLVAAFYEDHEHHEPSLQLLLRHERAEACCSAHSLAEVYATLTAMPGSKRVSPPEAVLYLSSLEERLTLIALDGHEYRRAVELAAASGATSGAVYDALIAKCFRKSGAQWLYTWNLRHFQRLPDNIGSCSRTPSFGTP
jgi:predicted nucleic acid-binding protein